MTPIAKFRCGHRRTDNNTDTQGGCRKCRLAMLARGRATQAKRRYEVDRTRWRKCDHPRTPENTYIAPGAKTEACRTCKNQASKRWRETHDDPRYAVHRHWKHPVFELVAVTPASEVLGGRSYAQFPLKRRSA